MGIVLEYIVWIIIGYFSGSVLYGYIMPKLLLGVDVRKMSVDGNPGTYNALKYGGRKLGLFVAFLEVMKGFLPVFLASMELDTNNMLFALVMVAPALGHGFSCFSRLKGGKCIGISYGIMLGVFPRIQPLITLGFIYIFLSKVIVITPHFCRTIITYLGLIITTFLLEPAIGIKIGVALVSLVVIGKHIKKMNGLKLEAHCPLLTKKAL